MEGTKELVGALVGSFTLTGRCLHGERSLLLAALSEGSQQDLAAGPSRTSQQDRSDVAGVAQQQDLAGPRSRTAVTPQQDRSHAAGVAVCTHDYTAVLHRSGTAREGNGTAKEKGTRKKNWTQATWPSTA